MSALVRRFSINDHGRDFVVGDVHGCFDDLRKAIRICGFDESKDRLFSVGDLVDRGPHCEESIDWIAKPWFHAVRGNHEQMAIGVSKGKHDKANYAYNGGSWFLNLTESRQRLFADVFSDLPYLIEVETKDGVVGIVHADIEGNSWDEFRDGFVSADSNNKRNRYSEVALWSRHRITYKDASRVSGVERIFAGHTPVRTPSSLGNFQYIDTGCVFGGHLAMCDLTKDVQS